LNNLHLLLMIGTAISLSAASSSAHAQEIGGGVDVPGDWWLGEGLKHGDYFSYRLCQVDYKECQEFAIDLWFEGDRQVGSESKWLAKAVVYDSGKTYKGEIEFGKIAAEPNGGTENLSDYRDAYKSSVSWLSAFATSYDAGGGDKGPKAFNIPSWGKIANIGGQQVKPLAVESVTVPAGTFDDAIKIGWRSGGHNSHIWIVDEFPFPIKASTWTHVAEGIPPQEYALTLLEYRENVSSDPFAGIVSDEKESVALGCPDNDNLQFTSLKKSTKSFKYGLDVLYKPEQPKQGCAIDWLIKFKSKYDETEFLNQVQYDILVVDDKITTPLRSLAADENKKFLYSPSGLAEREMLVKEPAGQNNYLIFVYGLAPEFYTLGPEDNDYLVVPITVQQNDIAGAVTPPEPPKEETKIPGWVKSNAKLWSGGDIDDDTFVLGLQYLIQERIIVIPDTVQGAGSDDNQIPGWVKSNAELWSGGLIDDDTFVRGIQFLIENGIILITP